MPAPLEVTLGARPLGDGRTRFRVWAPRRQQVEVLLASPEGARLLPLAPVGSGYFEGTHPVAPGALYKYRLDGGEAFPDPCSRFQPEGPHGPSQVVDPRAYAWRDAGWRGLPLEGQVLYELHVGAFSPEGTYDGVRARLPELEEVGITTLELMPVNTFPGRFNWGYDGVSLFAPCAAYGPPEALKRLVDEAHALGLAVLLDVVYNHLGPDGNYLAQYADGYFSKKYPGEWGDPVNFDDGEAARGVRDFVLQNAAYWVDEFHLDGLRLDATQSLFDASERHIVRELVDVARAAAPQRRVTVVCENEPQDVRCVLPPERGGHGADALWVDDFHHSARVAVAGRAEAYLQDYRGTAQELLSCALRNSLYQGQRYRWQDQRRGSPLLSVPAPRAVFFLMNHDQLANQLLGERLHVHAGAMRTRALTTFFLLLPQTPLLFMGQEWFASSPFRYFVDHKEELQPLVEQGRNGFLGQFPSAKCALEREGFQVPIGEEALRLSALDWSERERNAGPLALHRELLRLRREDPVFARQDARALAGAVLSPQALVLRSFGGEREGDRLLLLNLGQELELDPCPEPLLAPVPGTDWRLVLSSEETRFGGSGACDGATGEGGWSVPGQSALIYTSEEKTR